MPKKIDLEIGQRFGKLTVSGPCFKHGQERRYPLVCDCGENTAASVGALRYGHFKSCGCERTKHGHTRNHDMSVEYRVWDGIKQRCLNPRNISYRHYGGRGIKICERWLGKPNGFTNFLADVGPRPFPTASLDRIDNNGNYEPSNCRWTTRSVQSKNKRPARAIENFSTDALIAELWRRTFENVKTGVVS